MKSLLLTVLALLAGFAIGLGLRLPAGGSSAPDQAPPPTKSQRHGWAARSFTPANRMQGLAEMASTLDRDDWPAFFRSQLRSSETSRLAAALWVESDPSGFWNWLREQRDPLLLNRFADDLLRAWAATDPDAAMDAVIQITDKRTGDRLRRSVVDVALDADLQKGLELAARAGDFNRFGWGSCEWMKADPAAAVQGLAKLPDLNDYRGFLNYALPIWAETDPAAALEWMSREPSLPRDDWAGLGFAAAATANPQLALAAATQITEPKRRNEAIAGVLESGTVAPEEVPSLLSALPLSLRASVGRDLITSRPATTLAELRQTADLINELPANRNLLSSIGTLARNWSAVDRDSGWQWAETLTDPAIRREAFAVLATAGANSEPERLDAIATLPLLDLSDDLFRNALFQMPVDRQDAWIAQLPADRRSWAESVKSNR